jgi:hypothetical protein
LNDGDEGSGRVESVSEEKECNKIEEGLGELANFSDGEENLLPSNGKVVATFRNLRARARLLE